ncbi:HAD-IA family hydrolase [Enterococcus saccharolyticus]|uniref:HAD family hydrolase n=1 Tax=Enterococcus TaxID=1350 RepID=UPI001E299E65|nr:HAD-IA family hydrolase [Enterococcus saccharolyticus]MCD5001506.1 HAD-IA family hydrolase [Enterococcus saccharolyticus]
MIDTIIFDMDGVLVDSEYTFLRSKTEMLHAEGHLKDESYQYQFMGTTAEFMWQTMKDELQLPRSVAEYIAEMNQRRAEIIAKDGVRAISHVQEFVKKLAEAGFKLGVASSSRKSEIEANLTALGLRSYFAQLVSGEEVVHSKPAPDVFLKAAELLESKPENCLVFEDTRNGSKAAKAAGMYCIGFANPQYPIQELVADEIINDFQEVIVADLANKNSPS